MSEQGWLKQLLETNEDEKFSEKQINIIQAAIEMFSVKGYAATSTSEIAKKAGVAEGTIFRHYKTKKDLLLAIIVPTLSKIVAPLFMKSFIKDVFDDKFENYEQFLRKLIINRFDFVQKNLPILKIFIQEVAFHPEIKQLQTLFVENVYEKFVSVVQYFQEKGELVDFPPETIIRITMTNIIGHMVTRFIVMPNHNWDDMNEIDRTIHVIMHGLTKNNNNEKL